MLRVDADTVAICKDEWSILLGGDGKPYQDQNETKSGNIKWVQHARGDAGWGGGMKLVIHTAHCSVNKNGRYNLDYALDYF